MTATKILKSVLITVLLSCAWAQADDSIPSPREDGSFKVSEVRCQVVEGQVRCTFG